MLRYYTFWDLVRSVVEVRILRRLLAFVLSTRLLFRLRWGTILIILWEQIQHNFGVVWLDILAVQLLYLPSSVIIGLIWVSLPQMCIFRFLFIIVLNLNSLSILSVAIVQLKLNLHALGLLLSFLLVSLVFVDVKDLLLVVEWVHQIRHEFRIHGIERHHQLLLLV